MSNKVIIPEYNINGTYPSNYLFIVDKIPKTIFSLKSFPLPGISGTAVNVAYQNYTNKVPPDTLTFGDLSTQVFLDENWVTHKEIYTWFVNNVLGVNIEVGDIYSDGTLLFYNNSLKKVALRVKFQNMQPVGVQDIDLDNITVDETSFTANFVYDKYEIEYPLAT